MKVCNRCKVNKPDSGFYTNRRTNSEGVVYYDLRYVCKPCDRKISSEKRKAGGWKWEKARQGRGTKHAELSKKNSQRHRDILSDMYLKGLIVKKDKRLTTDDVSQEMIDIVRGRLILKRKLRKKKEED